MSTWNVVPFSVLKKMNLSDIVAGASFEVSGDGEVKFMVIVPPYPWTREDVKRILNDAEMTAGKRKN